MQVAADGGSRRVVVHVGYPKAASTTLQNAVFLELHRLGLINYVARAWESGYFGALSSHAEYKQWLHRVIGAAMSGGTLPPLPLAAPLDRKRINLFSEGLLINNERHQSRFVMPPVVKQLFAGHADDVQILIVARRQSSLLMSYFVHNYKKLRCRTFGDFLNLGMSSGWSGRFKIFDLHLVSTAFAEQFGRDNVHVMLFEDMVEDPTAFAAGLARLLQVDPAAVLTGLRGKHLNRTTRVDGVQLVRKMDPFTLRAVAWRLASALPGGLERLFDIRIPQLSDEDEARIMAIFRESNLALARDFGLDMAKLRAYRFC